MVREEKKEPLVCWFTESGERKEGSITGRMASYLIGFLIRIAPIEKGDTLVVMLKQNKKETAYTVIRSR